MTALLFLPYFSITCAAQPSPFLYGPKGFLGRRASRIALRARSASIGSVMTMCRTSPSSIRTVSPGRTLYFLRIAAGREIVPFLVTVTVYMLSVICPIIASSRLYYRLEDSFIRLPPIWMCNLTNQVGMQIISLVSQVSVRGFQLCNNQPSLFWSSKSPLGRSLPQDTLQMTGIEPASQNKN